MVYEYTYRTITEIGLECPGKEDLVGGRIHVFSAEPLAKAPKNGGDVAIGSRGCRDLDWQGTYLPVYGYRYN